MQEKCTTNKRKPAKNSGKETEGANSQSSSREDVKKSNKKARVAKLPEPQSEDDSESDEENDSSDPSDSSDKETSDEEIQEKPRKKVQVHARSRSPSQVAVCLFDFSTNNVFLTISVC